MAREKIIEIDGVKVGLKTSAAVPVLFNQEFTGKDFFACMQKLEEAYNKGEQEDIYASLMVVQEMAYVFAKHYALSHGEDFKDDYITWLSNFETFSIFNVMQEILGIWTEETSTKSVAKKKGRKPTEK